MPLFPEEYKVKYFDDLESIDLLDLLESSYPELLESISGDYILEYLDFDIFREIYFEGELVGFLTLNALKRNRFSIEECYILPQFRRKGIIYGELLKLASIPNVHLCARRPNYAFIRMLEKHGLTERVLDNIAGCAIEILADSDDIYVNPGIDFLYYLERPLYDLYGEYVYDFDTKLIYLQDTWSHVSISQGMIVLIKPRRCDREKFSYLEAFKDLTPRNICSISKRLFSKSEDIKDMGELWETALDKYNNVDEIIGTPERLADEMKELLDANGLDESVGFEIRSHIINANSHGQLKEKYNRTRRDYLIKNPDMVNAGIYIGLYNKNRVCPLCESDAGGLKNCKCCGFDFENMRSSRHL